MRRRQAIKRVHQTDPRFNSELVAKVIRTLMKSGKKTTAERIVYGAIDELAKETGKDPLEVMDAAINNMKPKVEVKSRRVGGATYPVPVEIRPGRQLALALRWMAQYASARRGVPMPRAVALELIDAYNNTGNVLKKRDDTHKMAQARISRGAFLSGRAIVPIVAFGPLGDAKKKKAPGGIHLGAVYGGIGETKMSETPLMLTRL